MQRYLIGPLPVIKRGVFNKTRKKTTEHIVENTEFTSAEKSTHVSVAVLISGFSTMKMPLHMMR
jgi:hypothetical protein